MHTEDEAKTKWCPFVRVTTGTRKAEKVNLMGGAATFNRVGYLDGDGMGWDLTPVTNCLGSACMAWRWEGDWYPEPAEFLRTGRGWCGLAGRPEI